MENTVQDDFRKKKKTLSVNTLRRIARGLDKFVIRSPRPFIMQMNYENTPQSVDDPLSTITAVNKHFVVDPILTPYVMSNNTNNAPHGINEPLPTVTAGDHNQLLAAHIATFRRGMDGQSVGEPLYTITAKAGHHAEVLTFLTKVGNDDATLGKWNEVRELLNTYAGYKIADDEILIFEVDGVPHFISDVAMRMLEPHELAAAQGFPPDYVLKVSESYSKAAQIARVGNSVCPVMATVLVKANLPELCKGKALVTMRELNERLTA